MANGDLAAIHYGDVVFVDATGKVIYAESGFDHEKVEKLIVAALSR